MCVCVSVEKVEIFSWRKSTHGGGIAASVWFRGKVDARISLVDTAKYTRDVAVSKRCPWTTGFKSTQKYNNKHEKTHPSNNENLGQQDFQQMNVCIQVASESLRNKIYTCI